VTDAIIDQPARPTLSDGRILLRPLAAADRDALYEAVAESREEVGRWMAWCHPDYSPDESAQWIAICERGWAAENGDREFAIFDARAGRLLGCIGVNQFNRVHHFANVGYWVRTSAARQGVATAAARLIARYAFDVLELARIEIVAQVPNVASCKVAEKLGCRLEGVLRARIAFRASHLDAAMYSLLPGDVTEPAG
jgi:RimJ/RimL family protein N-acetyltransferase